MSKVLKHEETINWDGKNFQARIEKVEELEPLELIDIEKSLKNAITNIKDEIEGHKIAIENLQGQIKSAKERIEEYEKRLQKVVSPKVVIARRNLTKDQRKQLEKQDKAEQEMIEKREKLMQTYKEVKEAQAG